MSRKSRYEGDFERQMRQRFPRGGWPHGAVNVRLVVGLLVVVLGVLFLISNLHIVDIYSPQRYFMAALLLSIGFALVIEHRTERSWQWGLGWIFAALWTFAYQARWIDINFWQMFAPLLMLGGGAYLIHRALTEGQGDDQPGASAGGSTNTASDGANTSSTTQTNTSQSSSSHSGTTVHGVGVLSSCEQKPSIMGSANLFALMGGVKLDLFETQLVNNTAVIHVGACMGGIEICVPSDWTVVNRVLPVMGAFIDKRRPAATIPTGDAVRTLNIDGFVLMGGIEIKN